MTVWELFNLKDQVAIVTGGAGKLGSQICDALAEAGAHVVVASRNLERCLRKAAELTANHSEALAIQADVTVPKDVHAMIESAKAHFGRIDILINNAYSGTLAPFETMTLDEWQAAAKGALDSTFLCSQSVAPLMKEQRCGAIVNIASMYGVVSPQHGIYGRSGINNPCNYGPAKAGVIQFTKWLATYLGPFNIRVNCISPGGFYSEAFKTRDDYEDVFVHNYCERTPLGRMGNDTDLKGAIVFLSSNASAWVTGHNLIIDGGWTLW
jgi:gluconate 5-dehydrogenase